MRIACDRATVPCTTKGDMTLGRMCLTATTSRVAHGEEQTGNAEEHVHDTVDGIVPGAAEITRGEPEGAPHEHGDGDGREGDVEGDAGAEDDPAQHVASEAVRAEERLGARSGFDQVEVLLGRRMRGEGGGEDGAGDDDERGDGAESDEGIAQDAAKLASQSHVTDGDGRRAEHPVHPGFHVRSLGGALQPVKSARRRLNLWSTKREASQDPVDRAATPRRFSRSISTSAAPCGMD